MRVIPPQTALARQRLTIQLHGSHEPGAATVAAVHDVSATVGIFAFLARTICNQAFQTAADSDIEQHIRGPPLLIPAVLKSCGKWSERRHC